MEAGKSINAYSNNIYSREFFQLIKDHLSEGGVFLVRESAGAGMLKTFLTVFDHVKRYNDFSLITNGPPQKDSNRWNSLLAQLPSDFIRKRVLDLSNQWEQVDLSASDLRQEEFSYYNINTDWKPVSEYYIGVKVRGLMFIPRDIRERFKTPYGF